MLLLKLNSTGDAVNLLQELLNELGHLVPVTGKFDKATYAAVCDFQLKNGLVVDGSVYTKTWVKLLNNVPSATPNLESKSLKESDIIALANHLGLEVAIVKAVNAVESGGRGFFIDGNPKLLFEGHVFWNELSKLKLDPRTLVSGNEDILFPKWDSRFYKGGVAEYGRLNKAIGIIPNNAGVTEAAYASASWGMFQIMGYHYRSLGYKEIIDFVGDMQLNEGKHLNAFGKFIEVNGMVKYLKNKDLAGFALRYNGSGYAKNKYDVKLKAAYEKFA